MEIKKVMVVGAGLMGSGIAQVCAQAGIDVYLNDVNHEALDRAVQSISWSVGKFLEKGKLNEAKEVILARIHPVGDFSAGTEVDLAIEAVFEKIDLKKEIFGQLDRHCQPRALIASNTSAIPITELAAMTKKATTGSRDTFFQPGADDAGGGGHQGDRHHR